MSAMHRGTAVREENPANAIQMSAVSLPTINRLAAPTRYDIEGQPVRCIEPADGKCVWLCDCPKF
jgi:hypothetical protein